MDGEVVSAYRPGENPVRENESDVRIVELVRASALLRTHARPRNVSKPVDNHECQVRFERCIPPLVISTGAPVGGNVDGRPPPSTSLKCKVPVKMFTGPRSGTIGPASGPHARQTTAGISWQASSHSSHYPSRNHRDRTHEIDRIPAHAPRRRRRLALLHSLGDASGKPRAHGGYRVCKGSVTSPRLRRAGAAGHRAHAPAPTQRRR